MASASDMVYIIVDPEFGEHLHDLAPGTPLWIADTPLNRAAVEAQWQTQPNAFDGMGVTTFVVDPAEEPAAWAAEILAIVLEHHPPVRLLEFIGTAPTQELRSLLAEYGFSGVEPTAAGFRTSAI